MIRLLVQIAATALAGALLGAASARGFGSEADASDELTAAGGGAL